MQELSILELAKQGGWIMIVLAILSIIAVYIFTDRFIAIRNAGKVDKLFMDRIRDYIKNNDARSAINYCRVTNTTTSRIIERGDVLNGVLTSEKEWFAFNNTTKINNVFGTGNPAYYLYSLGSAGIFVGTDSTN